MLEIITKNELYSKPDNNLNTLKSILFDSSKDNSHIIRVVHIYAKNKYGFFVFKGYNLMYPATRYKNINQIIEYPCFIEIIFSTLNPLLEKKLSMINPISKSTSDI